MTKELLEYLNDRKENCINTIIDHLGFENEVNFLEGKISIIDEVKRYLNEIEKEEKSKVEIIERQDKEIERLKNIISALDATLTYHQELQKQQIMEQEEKNCTKIAAYKEFAKKLKEKTETYIDENLFGEKFERNFVSEETIDNLLKELIL